MVGVAMILILFRVHPYLSESLRLIPYPEMVAFILSTPISQQTRI